MIFFFTCQSLISMSNFTDIVVTYFHDITDILATQCNTDVFATVISYTKVSDHVSQHQEHLEQEQNLHKANLQTQALWINLFRRVWDSCERVEFSTYMLYCLISECFNWIVGCSSCQFWNVSNVLSSGQNVCQAGQLTAQLGIT